MKITIYGNRGGNKHFRRVPCVLGLGWRVYLPLPGGREMAIWFI